ncbi:MAG: class I SAM-dependent methyltransferase [Solirubrobacteraceae bacterium]
MYAAESAIDAAELEKLMSRLVGDLGAAMSAALVVIGDRLGLYRAMRDGEPVTAERLARRTQTDARYVREWLSNQAAGGYVGYDAEHDTFFLTPEQSLAFAQDGSPVFIPGAFQCASAMVKATDRVASAFEHGHGIGWHEHELDLHCGTDRFLGAGYAASLVSSWIPALDDVQAKLEAGARVADVGCGHGASTVLMAQAFPRSEFAGFDCHPQSVVRAQLAAEEAGVADRVSFMVASAKEYPRGDTAGYDLVTMFDSLHYMGDPVGAAAHVLETVTTDGTLMLVEPNAGDCLQDNLNPIGRMFYAASTLVSTPASRAQDLGPALSAQAGERRLRAVVTASGFSRWRRAAETRLHLVLEARP